MTTISSDSESQDSDDGRRFRFEATRKDDNLRLHSHKRISTLSKDSSHRSRSVDRSRHNRRDSDKVKQDRDRKEGGNERRKNSKDRESIRDNKHDRSNNKDSRHANKGNFKDVKELNESKNLMESEKRDDNKNSNNRDCKESTKNSSNSKDYKNSKDSRLRESRNRTHEERPTKDGKIRESKESKDQDAKSVKDREIKTSRDLEIKNIHDRDRGPKRTHDSSYERLSIVKHRHRSRDKYRSRDRSNTRDKSKQRAPENLKEKDLKHKRGPKKQLERKILKRENNHSPSKILDQIGSDSESDLGALDSDVGPVLSLETLEGCKEINLSDFDIISDTEGTSSDSPDTKLLAVKGPIIRGEILEPHYYGPRIKKRVSRRQYERMMRRQAAVNKRCSEELYKVNPRNNEVSELAPSNNNPGAVSDFSLGAETSVSAVEDHHRSRKSEEETCEDKSDDRDLEDRCKLIENKDKNLSKLHRLPIDELSLASLNEKTKSVLYQKSSTTIENYKELPDTEIYGPVLPPKCIVKNPLHHHDPSTCEVEEAVQKPSVSRGASSQNLSEKNVFIETKIHRNLDSPTDFGVPILSNKNTNESKDVIIGPSLPPGMRLGSESPKPNSQDVYGPSFLERPTEKNSSIIGPSLPPHLCSGNASNSVISENEDSASPQCSVFGPTLPPHLISGATEKIGEKSSSDSEDDFLGPMPANHPASMDNYIQRQLEDRARRMKNKLEGEKSNIKKREEWMLELPAAQAANLGLDKRQFRNRAGPDMSDRSSWTDTPADKARKKEEERLGKTKVPDLAKESERLAIEQRDKEMEKMADKHKSKKRKESLLEIHKKKLHKKKKKEEKEAKETGKSARRPFDRDIDLQANRFDEAQKKSILKKAQLLNNRFSRGESKYL